METEEREYSDTDGTESEEEYTDNDNMETEEEEYSDTDGMESEEEYSDNDNMETDGEYSDTDDTERDDDSVKEFMRKLRERCRQCRGIREVCYYFVEENGNKIMSKRNGTVNIKFNSVIIVVLG